MIYALHLNPRVQLLTFSKTKYLLKVEGDGKSTDHLGADYSEDKDGALVSQPKKNIDKLEETVKKFFTRSTLSVQVSS